MKLLLPFILILLLNNISAQSNWELQRDESKIKVWTKDYPDSKFKQFKAETRVKASLENVVAVFLDIENMGLWYDRVEKVEMVEKFSDMEGTYKIDFGLPWPVADRVSAVRATLSYDPSTNVVRVDTNYEPGIITDTDVPLVTVMFSEWVLTPIEGGFVHIFHEGYMDPAGSLPAWMSNSGVKDGPLKTLKALKGILSNYIDVDVAFLKD
ncbi:MAG: hypothetical protein ACJATI_001671 [Halioglobus sp.]|jgi:hypothetical protein